MKKVIAIICSMILILGFAVGCSKTEDIVSTQETTELSINDQVVGVWIINEDINYNFMRIELYRGGTGKAFDTKEGNGNMYYNISWEVNDDIINIDFDSSGHFKYGFELSDNTLSRVDGTHSYIRVEE